MRALGAYGLTAVVCALSAGGAAAADIAVVKSGPASASQAAIAALRAATSGHAVTEYDLANDGDNADRILSGLRGRAAVAVAFGSLAAQSVHAVLPEVPLVYCMVPDLEEAGLEGAANTTGVAFFAPVRNQLVAFRAVNPAAKRIGIVVSTDAGRRYAEEARRGASSLGLEVVVLSVTSLAQVPPTVRDMIGRSQPVDAVWMVPDALLSDALTRRFIFSTALEAHKPVYGYSA